MINKEQERKFQVQHNIAICILFFIFLIGCSAYYIKNKNNAIPAECVSESHSLIYPCNIHEEIK